MEKRDVFILLGLLCLVGGICYEFSPGVGVIVAGVVLLGFGLLGGDR